MVPVPKSSTVSTIASPCVRPIVPDGGKTSVIVATALPAASKVPLVEPCDPRFLPGAVAAIVNCAPGVPLASATTIGCVPIPTRCE